jgi:hypothetical protein
MARYSAGMTAAGAGTTVRPIFGILSTAAVTPQLREVGLFNTTVTACTYRLVYVTGGTPGATVTAYSHRATSLATPTVLAKQLWTADATVTADTGYRMVLGAAIGSGAILTFGDDGLSNPLGATIALGLIPVGTGQVCEVYFVWDE